MGFCSRGEIGLNWEYNKGKRKFITKKQGWGRVNGLKITETSGIRGEF